MEEIRDLSAFVQEHAAHYDDNVEEQESIRLKWREVDDALALQDTAGEPPAA